MKDGKDSDQLLTEMNAKNREQLLKSDGLAGLFIYNLENFAFRYLETSQDRDIKCKFLSNRYWVESIEPVVMNALKWDNLEVRKTIVGLCKKFPGAESKKIHIQLLLETKMINDQTVECSAAITSLNPDQSTTQIASKNISFSFSDPIELRNRHATLLENVAEIF